MKNRLIAAVSVSALAIVVPSGSALSASWEPGPAGWSSGPLRHVRTIPAEAGGAIGGTIHDGYLYVTTFRSFSIYDVSAPADPRLVSTTLLGPQAINEGPATNGEILLTMRDTPSRLLRIWDVSNKAAPREIGSFASAPLPDHIWTCVFDCAYAYGSGGSILDLSNPAAPVRIGNWRTAAPTRGVHGIAEVAPGLVLTGSLPQYYLDATADPANPTVLATAEPPTTRFNQFRVGPPLESPVSYVEWPRNAQARHALTTLETPFSGACNENSGSLVVYDTHKYAKTGTFAVADLYRITRNGTPDQGLAPENAIGCSALDLDPHPRWQDRRLVAVGWAEHGVRLLRVDPQGQISEVGGFLGHGTEAFAPIWASERILYSIDTARGIDVLELTS